MADPIRLNAPVSPNGAAAIAPMGAQIPPAGIALPNSVTLDGRDRSRPTLTGNTLPGSGPIGLVAPGKFQMPAVQTLTVPAESVIKPFDVTGMSKEDGQKLAAEGQRVMRDINGIGFGRQPTTFQELSATKDTQKGLRPEASVEHLRMQRMYLGLPVFGEQTIVHFNKSHQVVDITNKETPAGLSGLSIKPAVTADEALAAARAAMGTSPKTQTQPELGVIKKPNGEYALAYHMILENLSNPRDPQRNHFFIDAQDKSVIVSYNEIHGFMDGAREFQRTGELSNGGIVPPHVDASQNGPQPRTTLPAPSAPQSAKTLPPTSGEKPASKTVKAADAPAPGSPDCPPVPQAKPAPGGTGNSYYLGQVDLNTTQLPDGSYIMRDMGVRGAEVRDARNTGSTELGADGFPAGATPINDYNNVWGESADNPRNKAAIDAQYAAVKYDEYLHAFFDRDGIDNHGQQPRAVVHTGDQMVNAFYYGKVMWYGDGDGVTAGVLVDKDVASHEPTHGLTESSSALQYWGESGAINEAMSDILGSAGFSWYLRGHKDTGIPTDFTIGEDCWTPAIAGDALRYMDHPMKDREGDSIAYSRDHYTDRYQGWGDNGGVHLNSGIANNAFYLMSKGGTNDTSKVNVPDGMGIQDALQIFYRTNTVYLTPTSDFSGAREASIKAAVDLFGDDSKQVKIAQQAWSAVGVNAPAATPQKFPLPVPTPASAPTSGTPVPAPTKPATLVRKAA